MAQTQTISAALPVVSASYESAAEPWTIWFMVAGIALNVVAGIWDDTWHASIGVDTSWAPPHILTQVSAVLALIACTYAIVTTTLGGDSSVREASLRVLSFFAPGGVFIAAWGCLATLVGGQFDNWWHHAYGDVTPNTPPHLLLLIGALLTQIGGTAWIASAMNRSRDELRRRLTWLLLFVGSTGLGNLTGFLPDTSGMHRADYYMGFAVFIPSWLVACGCALSHKWGSTIAAAFYTGVSLGAEWLLPLFPAQPRFGPVYHNVTHLIPPGFPLLLIVPAFTSDALLLTIGRRSSWVKAVLVGPALLLSFLGAQWAFANFLMLPASRNWIFGSCYFAYRDPAGLLYDSYKFQTAEKPGAFLLTMAIAFVASIVTTRLGLAWGNWMRLIRR